MSKTEKHHTGQRAPERQKNRFNGVFVLSAVIITAIISFVAGTRSNDIVAVMLSQVNIATVQDKLDLDEVQQTYRVLKTKYNGTLDRDKLVQNASKGLVNATGDPYTEYFTAKEAKALQDDLSGNIGGGIGAELGSRNGKVTVIRPLDNSPAQEAGVQAGDVILAVNDEVMQDKMVEDVVKVVRGEIGSTVKLLLERGAERKEVSVKRAEIIAPDVETDKRGDIGIISLSRFGTESALKVRAAAEELKKQGVKAIVLDMRGNGGGYLQSGVDVAGVWLNDKVVVKEKSVNGDREERTGRDALLEGMPTVVLINAGSASASEIVAGALRDHEAATILGEKSYGKGSVQELVDLTNGDMLKVTIAKWYTPAGKSISKNGIKPDKEVKLTSDDVNANRDPQLDAAIGQLSK